MDIDIYIYTVNDSIYFISETSEMKNTLNFKPQGRKRQKKPQNLSVIYFINSHS